MAEPQPAQLAFLTDPEPGVVLLNVQVDGELQRFQINRDQLFILNKDTADIMKIERHSPVVAQSYFAPVLRCSSSNASLAGASP
jgi:hypothetical protein